MNHKYFCKLWIFELLQSSSGQKGCTLYPNETDSIGTWHLFDLHYDVLSPDFVLVPVALNHRFCFGFSGSTKRCFHCCCWNVSFYVLQIIIMIHFSHLYDDRDFFSNRHCVSGSTNNTQFNADKNNFFGWKTLAQVHLFIFVMHRISIRHQLIYATPIFMVRQYSKCSSIKYQMAQWNIEN